MMRQDRHARWPARRFYWAVLDVSVLPRTRRRSRQHCGYLLEPHLPLPIDAVQAVYVRMPDERVLACAIERRALDRELDPRWRTLTPDDVPEAIAGAGAPDPRGLNVLIGDYLPPDARAGARRSVLQLVMATAVILVLAVIGVHRRAAAMDAVRADIDAEISVMLGEVTGHMATTTAERSMQQTRLGFRIDELRRTRQSGVAEAELVDAAATMARVLAVWPPDSGAKIDTFNVASDAVLIRGILPDSQMLGRVVAALGTLEGWVLQHPDSTVVPDGLSVVLRLHRQEEAS